MPDVTKYIGDLLKNGRPVSEINPGSNQVALRPNEALRALELLKNGQTAVLGGDVFSEDGQGGLSHAYVLWGSKYCYLNWCCDPTATESAAAYSERSIKVAADAIVAAQTTAEKLMKTCLIALVVKRYDSPEILVGDA